MYETGILPKKGRKQKMEQKTETETKAKNETESVSTWDSKFNSFVDKVLVRSARDKLIVMNHGHDALVEDIIQFPKMHSSGASKKTIEELETISKFAKHMAHLMKMKELGYYDKYDYVVDYDPEWEA